MTVIKISHVIIGDRIRVDFGDLEALAASMAEIGLLHPIVLSKSNVLIAGQRRIEAARKLGWTSIPATIIDLDEIVLGEYAENELRKDFTVSERVAIGRAVEAALGNRQGQRTALPQNFAEVEPGKETRQIAAERAGFGNAETYRQAKTVIDEGTPELVEAVERGRASVSAAAQVATLPKEEQKVIVARGEDEIIRMAKEIRERKSEEKARENASVASRSVEIPEGKFGTIVIDPPWPMKKIDRDVRPNQVDFDYPTVSIEELGEYGERIEACAADDCHLFVWTPQEILPPAIKLLKVWDFRYVLTMVWHKPGAVQPISLPQYNCEFALYARRGSPRFVNTKAFKTCFTAPERDYFLDLIRRVTGQEVSVITSPAE